MAALRQWNLVGTGFMIPLQVCRRHFRLFSGCELICTEFKPLFSDTEFCILRLVISDWLYLPLYLCSLYCLHNVMAFVSSLSAELSSARERAPEPRQ